MSSRTVVSSVKFLNDTTVLSADCDGTVKVWSLANYSRPISTITVFFNTSENQETLKFQRVRRIFGNIVEFASLGLAVWRQLRARCMLDY